MSLQRIRESINCKRPSVIGTFYSLASSTTSFKEKLQTFAFHQSPDPVWPQSSFEKTDFHTISVTAAVSQTRDTVPHITVETNFKPILRAPNYSTHLGISTAIASSPFPRRHLKGNSSFHYARFRISNAFLLPSPQGQDRSLILFLSRQTGYHLSFPDNRYTQISTS